MFYGLAMSSGGYGQSKSSGGGGFTSKQWAGAGSYLSGLGTAFEGKAQKAWYTASIKASELQADEAMKKATWEVTRQRLLKRKWIGGARAMFGWAGVDIEGSPMDVIAEADREMTLDEMMTTREGWIDQQIALEEAKWQRKAKKYSSLSNAMQGTGQLFGGIFGMGG